MAAITATCVPTVRVNCRSPAQCAGLKPARLFGHRAACFSFRAGCVTARAADEDNSPELSGEWAANWSLASYEDVGQFFQDKLFKDEAAPGTSLGDIMSVDLRTTTPDADLASIQSLFNEVSGIPVVKTATDRTLVGVVSKKDLQKSGSLVKEVMSSPPIAASPSSKVADAACLMLKHKVHRIPIVDSEKRLIGIVTRTDIFTALEAEP